VKELAVMVVRSRDGSVLSYPVVETIHKVRGEGATGEGCEDKGRGRWEGGGQEGDWRAERRRRPCSRRGGKGGEGNSVPHAARPHSLTCRQQDSICYVTEAPADVAPQVYAATRAAAEKAVACLDGAGIFG
jgi:hypothetical protein